MKKTIIVFVLILACSYTSYSQIAKNTWLLGGQFYGNYGTSESGHISIDPNTGYFLSDQFCLGLSLPVVTYFDKNNFDVYTSVAPFARLYLSSNEPHSLFFSTALALLSYSNTGNNNVSLVDYVSVGVGYVLMLNESVGLEMQALTTTDFNDIDLGLRFGFQIYFNGTSK